MITLPTILLLLFVVNLGTAFGAGLYEMRIVLPMWFHRAADGQYEIDYRAMRQTDVGRRFWGMVTTAPLTLLTLINVFLAWQSHVPANTWWLAAAFVALAERLGTLAFFIPTAIRIERSDLKPLSNTSDVVSRWVQLNYVRNLFTLAALLLALRAILLL
jgi:hypothetical protein